ncbi:LapA family protein [Cardiobacteriaceae bacterium TAE3-ERU3]|nr:LapA family protein [Cardiobacteriaceae bacterium TAE3-ERU3]
MKLLGYIIVIALGIVFALMGLFNSNDVAFNYLFGERDLPLVVVMVLSFLCGALFTLLVFGVKVLFWRGRAKKLQAQLDREHREAHHEAVKSQYEAESAVS